MLEVATSSVVQVMVAVVTVVEEAIVKICGGVMSAPLAF